MAIIFLSESSINRIAAGEVVERPASVVKELVENSIDAKATKIEIILEAAGKNLIVVSDDGSGMTQEELTIAVQRHTTSKLDESDLFKINSFGFRGEALPSIASISRMSITSKARYAEKGFQIQLVGGEQQTIKQAVCNFGTTIEIRDLFFATPARLKFLRSDATELAASLDCVKKIALAHTDIEFTFIHNGKILFKVKKQESDSSLRINKILGDNFINNAAILDFKDDSISIKGYISVPTLNKSNSSEQFFFVNNRPVKDKILSIALRIAYQDYLARDRHPIAVIFLQLGSELVDVNVHPAKSEVRFQEQELIRKSLINAMKSALFKESHKTSTTIADEAVNLFVKRSIPAQNQIFFQDHKNRVSENFLGNNYRSMNQVKHETKDFEKESQQKFIDTAPQALIHETSQNEDCTADYPLGAVKTQLLDSYIIAQTNDSIIIVDQHAADERLLYEKIKAQYLTNKELIKQRLLIPQIVEFKNEEELNKLVQYFSELSKLGLTLEKFGTNSVIISEVPSLLGPLNIERLIHELAEDLLDTEEEFTVSKMFEHVLETYACHHSIRFGRKLSPTEMNKLLRDMENTPFSGQCNHGRPTYIELKFKDIEKLFGRK